MTTSSDFNKLPTETQNALIDIQSGRNGTFVFPVRTSFVSLVPAVFVVGWLIYAYSSSQGIRWEPWMFWIILAISFLSFPIAFVGLVRFLSPKFSKLKNGHIVTSNEYFKVNGRQVDCVGLKEIDALRLLADEKQIELWSGTHEERIAVDDIFLAEKLDAEFDQLKENAINEFQSVLSDSKYAYSKGVAGTLTIVGIVVAAALGGGAAYFLNSMNQRSAENVSWQQAKSAATIDALDSFKVQFPNGYFASEADQAILSLAGSVKEKYLAKVKKGANPESVAALGAFLEAAAKRPDRTVLVKIDESREIDPSIVPALESQNGVTVSTYESSVPVSPQPRKEKAFTDIQLLLSAATERGMIRAQLVDVIPDGAPSIHVFLTIKPDKSLYRMVYFDGGRYSSTNYPGATFLFDVTLNNGDGSAPFKTQYFGQAMRVDTGTYDKRDRENYSFDKMLFLKVMDGFDKNFETTFGLAENSVPVVQ